MFRQYGSGKALKFTHSRRQACGLLEEAYVGESQCTKLTGSLFDPRESESQKANGNSKRTYAGVSGDDLGLRVNQLDLF